MKEKIKMKKVVVLWSSPNPDGLTASAKNRIPVVRYNRDYILPALAEAGKTYIDRLENGFDMYY